MRKYYVEDTDETYDDIDELIDDCIEEDFHEDDDYFEDWVNDHYNYVVINGETYYPYDILDNMDQSNLDELRTEYCEEENDNDISEARFELENNRVGTEVYIHNKTVRIIEEEETEDFDGDEIIETLEDVRTRLKEKEAFKVEQTVQTEKEEKDLMSMFQIVGE